MATERKYLSLEKLSLYDEKIKKVITDGDAATLQAAKDFATGLADNYDAAGAAATAEANAKAHAEAQVAAEAEIARAAEQANATAAANAKTAADNAQAAADKAQEEVDALETYVGTFTHDTAKSVVEYINAKTDGIATSGNLEALGTRVTAVEGDVAAIKGDYLKAADKEELAGQITAEAEAARAAEKANADAIKAIQDDYLKASDKEELQDNIDTVSGAVELLTNGVDADKVDGVNDLIRYVEEHGSEVTGMQEDISENAEKIAALEGKMTTAEGKIADLETESAKHATTEALEAAVAALEGADAGQVERIAALEAKFGEGDGSVEDQISDAQAAAVTEAVSQAEAKDVERLAEAKKYTDDEIAELDLANTYAAKVHGHEMAEVTGLVDALAGKQAAGDYATKAEAQAMADGKDAAIAEAKKAGTDAAAALEAYKTTNDAAVQANAAAIAAFVEISEAEINGLFA